MANSPLWKIYSSDGEYVGALKDSEDAAALVALRGDGATVRFDHSFVVWREGAEAQSAAESYDFAADVMRERVARRHDENSARLRERQEQFARERQQVARGTLTVAERSAAEHLAAMVARPSDASIRRPHQTRITSGTLGSRAHCSCGWAQS